jgi:hypothetical protein
VSISSLPVLFQKMGGLGRPKKGKTAQALTQPLAVFSVAAVGG